MDKKSEEELERIANEITAEMVRGLNAPKPATGAGGNEPEDQVDEDEDEADEDAGRTS
jgi:hypothetical protein